MKKINGMIGLWMACSLGMMTAEAAGVVDGVAAEAAGVVDGVAAEAAGLVDSVADSPVAAKKLYAVGRVKPDGCWLRWAPEDPADWELMLRQGVVVERYTYYADTLMQAVYRRPPLGVADSLDLAGTSDAWVAAMGELLFADSLDIGPGGRFSRLSQEREHRQMRFALALLIGDRSYAAACAGLMGWRDVQAKGAETSGLGRPAGAGEASAYLYRIYVPGTAMDTAVVFLRPREDRLLPPRVLLRADFRDATATLCWDSRMWAELCVGYYVERSVNGGPYAVCNAQPIDVLQRDRQAAEMLHYVDSLPGRQPVRYRVMGVDLFGDRYQVTGEASGEAEATGLSSPEIERVTAASRGGVELSWGYPQAQQKALARFEVFVKDSMSGPYRRIASADPKTRRLAVPANRLRPSAYFCVAAYNHREEVCYSAVRFYQEKDTTPPLPPVGLVAYADTGGGVHLSWRPSPSGDVAGYYVLKSRRFTPPSRPSRADRFTAARPSRLTAPASAPPAAVHDTPWQLHAEPVTDTVYTDSIDALLWQAAYYYVAAVDQNGNLSALSEAVQVFPNRPNPMAPPLFDGCVAEEKRLKIRWYNSQDTYLTGCALYVSVGDGEPQLVARRAFQLQTFQPQTFQPQTFQPKPFQPQSAGPHGAKGTAGGAGANRIPGANKSAGRVHQPPAPVGLSVPPVDSLYYPLPKGRAFDTRYRFMLAAESQTGDTVWAPMPYEYLQEAEPVVPQLQAWPEREKRCVAVQWQIPPYTTVTKAYLYRRMADGPFQLLQVLLPPVLTEELYVDRRVHINTLYTYRLQFETTDGTFTPFGQAQVNY